MKRRIISLFFIVSCLALFVLFAPLRAKIPYDIWTEPQIHGIAARVGDRAITFEEMRRRIAPLLQEVLAQIPESRRTPELVDRTLVRVYLIELQRRVDELVIINDFNNRQYQVPEVFLEAEYQRLLKEQFNGDHGQLSQYLKRNGMTKESFRRDIAEDLIVLLMRRQVLQPLQISPEKILRYYRQLNQEVKLGTIRLAEALDQEDLWQQANGIIRELNKGVPFTQLAQQFGFEDESELFKWRKLSDLRPEIRKAITSLPPGGHSQPLLIAEQIFIFYVADKRDVEAPPLQGTIRSDIEAMLKTEQAQALQEKWLTELHEKAHIKYY